MVINGLYIVHFVQCLWPACLLRDYVGDIMCVSFDIYIYNIIV